MRPPSESARVLRPRAALLALAALGLLLAWLILEDIRSGTAGVEQLMQAQARSVSDLIRESSTHGFEVYRRWEDEVAARLLDNARWIARRDSVRPWTEEELSRLASVHALGRINLFDAHGEKVASSWTDAEIGIPPRHDPRDFIAPILRGEARELRIGFKEARFRGGSRFAVAVARRGGGAIVVNIFADSMRATLESVQPQHLLGVLGAASGVRYLLLQRADSVLAASPPGAAALGTDSSLGGLRPGAPPRIRERREAPGPAYEVAQVVGMPDGSEALLRVGLDPAPLERARAGVRARVLARTAWALLVAALAAGLLMVRQRHRIMTREMVRVRAELEARERESARQARLAAMGEMAARVAHEVRNPLNTILMIAQRLNRRSDLGESLREDVEDVTAESRRIEGTVQRFLDLARPLAPRLEPLEVAAAVAASARAARAAFEAAGVELAVAGEPAHARLDPAMLAEIVDNLLRNAREASPRGARVSVEVRRDAGRVVIAVEDAGPGVDPALRERVFDPFFSTKPEGIGLGLSTVAQLAASMDGTVTLERASGGGARFVIGFPGAGEKA